MLVSGVLLVLDLVLLPWHRVSIGLGSLPGIHVDSSGIESPDAALGILALLLAAALVVQLLVAKLTGSRLPQLPEAWGRVAPGRLQLLAGSAVVGLLLVKLFLNTDFLGAGSWLGVLLAGSLAYGELAIERDRSGRSPGASRTKRDGTLE